MTSIFNNLGRMRGELIDESQSEQQNVRFNNYMLSNYFSDPTADDHITFATAQQANQGKIVGAGIVSSLIDMDSKMTLQPTEERQNTQLLGKLQLQHRPFLTVPYLGKGTVDTVLESQLLQGEWNGYKKSTNTVMDKTFVNPEMYPMNDALRENIQKPENYIEEMALEGWTRGGSSTRAHQVDLYRNTNENGF